MKNNSALLVIDMQNVYLPGNEWSCIKMSEVINYIQKKINDFKKNQVFFTQQRAFQNPKGQWKVYNQKYANIKSKKSLNDYMQDLKKYLSNDNLFIKSGYSALSNSDLLETLDKFDTIYITGVIAECCVLSTIFGLVDMGKKIVYCRNGIAGQNEEMEKAVTKVLEEISPLHIEFE